MDLSNLEFTTVDYIRECIGLLAVLCGFMCKIQLGDMKRSGWWWGLGAGFCWILFSFLIFSPVSFLNNILYIVLSVRGLYLWKDMKKDSK